MVRINLQPPAASPSPNPAGQRRTSAPAVASDDPLILPFAVQRDLRERAAGWTFAGFTGNASEKYRPLIVPLIDKHMLTGDYTIEGVPVFIERKSAEDFLSTIIHGRENFEKEHQRMREIESAGGSCLVIVEAGLEQIIAELESGNLQRRIHPNSVRGSVASFGVDYGIPWLFAGSRRAAEEMALAVLRKAWERALVRA